MREKVAKALRGVVVAAGVAAGTVGGAQAQEGAAAVQELRTFNEYDFTSKIDELEFQRGLDAKKVKELKHKRDVLVEAAEQSDIWCRRLAAVKGDPKNICMPDGMSGVTDADIMAAYQQFNAELDALLAKTKPVS